MRSENCMIWIFNVVLLLCNMRYSHGEPVKFPSFQTTMLHSTGEIGGGFDVFALPWREYSIHTTKPLRFTPKIKHIVSLESITPSSSPTSSSNWLIPGSLIIGENPRGQEAEALHDAGVDTFVSLIGEYDFATYQGDYPNSFMRPQSDSSHLVDFMHFPIRDFQAASVGDVFDLVVELKRRITNGHTVYVHCRKGHGRTGMVVIPLIAEIFEVSIEDAQKYVLGSTLTYRASDQGDEAKVAMPETAAQLQVVEEVGNYFKIKASSLAQ